MIISLVMDWADAYSAYENLRVVANKGFMTGVYCGIAAYALSFLMNREDAAARNFLSNRKKVIRAIGITLLYLSGLFEILFQFSSRYPTVSLHTLYAQAYTFLFVIVLLTIRSRSRGADYLQALLLTACVIIYLLFASESHRVQEPVLTQNILSAHFIFSQMAIAVLMSIIFFRLIGYLRQSALKPGNNVSLTTWFLCTAIVIFVSVEVHLLVNHVFYSPANSLADIRRVYMKTGLAILWGVSSFILMWMGMKHKYQPLRIFSLTLFSVTLVKLFAFDIQNIPPAGKIAAFFCLGVLLLIISFMYQRLKKIIIEDVKPSETSNE
jgi:hypothetical protein